MSQDKSELLKEIKTKSLKVAQDLLETVENTTPESEAGPQEVVDALVESVKDLEQIVAIIPAEPSAPAGDDIDDQSVDPEPTGDESPVEESQVEEDVVPPVESLEDKEEKDILEAKLARLEKELDEGKKDKIANKIAQLYGGSEAKYASIMKSDKDSKYWAASLETLEDFVKATKSLHSAKSFSSFVKTAKQDDGMKML